MTDIFRSDMTTDPYWWEAARPSGSGSAPIPDDIEIAIVGSGYTGLNAAIELADRGHRVTVLEAREFGFGASSRSGGHVSGGLNLGKAASSAKPSPLITALGRERYNSLLGEAHRSLEHIEALIEREAIDCQYRRGGRFVAAYTPQHFKALEAKLPGLDPEGLNGCRMVPRARQGEEIGSGYYHGGMVMERSGKLHPALYTRGLLDACQRRGVTLCADAPVSAVRPEGSGFRLRVGDKEVRAAAVLLSTNAYAERPSPWLRRRIIPIASCMIATEELDAGLIRRLIIKERTISDTKRVLNYYRVSPDGKRLLFGGRESFFSVDPRYSGRRLYERMVSIYPELSKVRVTHSWAGLCAMTFDHLPHMGCEQGIHYVAGCNGSGVAMLSYLGYRVAAKMAGADTPSAFDGLGFPTRPMYTGNTWFLPLIGGFYKTMDRLERGRG